MAVRQRWGLSLCIAMVCLPVETRGPHQVASFIFLDLIFFFETESLNLNSLTGWPVSEFHTSSCLDLASAWVTGIPTAPSWSPPPVGSEN